MLIANLMIAIVCGLVIAFFADTCWSRRKGIDIYFILVVFIMMPALFVSGALATNLIIQISRGV